MWQQMAAAMAVVDVTAAGEGAQKWQPHCAGQREGRAGYGCRYH